MRRLEPSKSWTSPISEAGEEGPWPQETQKPWHSSACPGSPQGKQGTFPQSFQIIESKSYSDDECISGGLDKGEGERQWGLWIPSLSTSPSETGSSSTDIMRPPMAPYSMSWMLISSLVLLSQVQGKIYLSEKVKGPWESPVAMVSCTWSEETAQNSSTILLPG